MTTSPKMLSDLHDMTLQHQSVFSYSVIRWFHMEGSRCLAQRSEFSLSLWPVAVSLPTL